MAGIDYTNIRQDIEELLGGNSLDNQEEKVNPYTGEVVPSYSVQPKDSPLYKGPVNPLLYETMLDNPGLTMSTLNLENQISDEEVEEIENELKERDRNNGLSEFEILEREEFYKLQAREHLKLKIFLATDLETGKLLHPKELQNIHNQYISERFSPENYNLTEEYENLKLLERLFTEIELDSLDSKRDDKTRDNYKESIQNVVHSIKSRNAFDESYTELQLRDDWKNVFTNDDRKKTAILQTGRSIYKGDELNEFLSGTTELQEQMLANTYISSERYKKVNEKLKEYTSKPLLFKFSPEAELIANDFDDYTNYALERAMHNKLYRTNFLKDTDSWGLVVPREILNKGDDFISIVGGFGLTGLGAVTKFVGNLVGKADLYVLLNSGEGKYDTDVALSIDSRVAQLADLYIELKSAAREKALRDAVEDGKVTKEQLANEWDRIARLYSSIFKIHEGTGLTEIIPSKPFYTVEDEKIHQLAKFYTRANLNNGYDAQAGVVDYYKNTAHDRLTWVDYIANTGGGFLTNLGACTISFCGILNAAARELAPLPFYSNPLYGNNDNGLIDYLVKSETMQYATALQETGCWTPSEQKKYRAAGISDDLIFRSTEQENLFMSSADIPDLIAQYGFTAATTGASLIGSGAIRYAANKAQGRIAKKVMRAALKVGLASEETTALKVSTNEFISGAIARDLYYGNLFMAGLLGTGEGALEATSTYNTFIKDALYNPEVVKARDRLKQIENASKEQLESYMTAHDFPVRFAKDAETGQFKRVFTDEEYNQAREQLALLAKDMIQDINNRIEDNALDAACANFFMNSFINGALNVTLKSSLLSRDMKEALRAHKLGKALSSYIDIVEKDGKYMAVVKNRTPNPLGSSVWKSMVNDPKKTTRYLIDKVKSSTAADVYRVGKGAVKTAWGESLEEYEQGISDAVSRAAFQADMESYLDVVYDPEVRKAYQSDLFALLSTGLNEMGALAANIDNIREGVFGFLSTLIGGASPGRFLFSLASNTRLTYRKRSYTQLLIDQMKDVPGAEAPNMGVGSAFRDYGNAFKNSLKDLYEGAILNAYRENREDQSAGLEIADNINTWLQNKDALALLTHLGGAIGFKKMIYESTLQGDEYGARNNKLGLAIENIGMLEALKDTKLYEAYMTTILQMATIGEDAEFDGDGNYIGEDQNVLSAISLFKNQEGELSRNTLKSDKDILEKIRSNAEEFIFLRLSVLSTLTKIQKIFKSDKENNIDPLILNALTYYVLSSEDAGKRHDALELELMGAIVQLQKDAKLNLELKKGKKPLSASAIKALVEYGSILGIRKAIEEKKAERGRLKAEDLDYSDIRLVTNNMERKALEAVLSEIMQATMSERKIDEKEEAKKVTIIGEGNAQEDSKLEDLLDITTEDLIGLAMNDIHTLADIIAVRLQVEKNEAVNSSSKYRRAIDILLLAITNKQKGPDVLSEQFRATSKETAEAFIDMLALRQKSLAYENYLSNYILNPDWLSMQANNLRKKQRKETVRRLYKSLLRVEKGETAADVVKRVGEKVAELREQGKEEDAEILENLLREVDKYKNYVRTMRSMGTPTFLDKDDLIKVMSIIESVALLSNTQDFNELAAVFELKDIFELISQNEGRVFLLLLETHDLKPMSFIDDRTELRQLINKAKYAIDTQLEKIKQQQQGFKIKDKQPKVEERAEQKTEHIPGKDNSSNKSETTEKQPTQKEEEENKQLANQDSKGPTKNEPNPPLKKPETPTLGVTTWGDLDDKSPEYQFLSKRKSAVETALRDIGEPKNRHNEKNESNLSMKVIRMDNGSFGLFLCYKMVPIGTINPNTTAGLASAFNNALQTLERLGIKYWDLGKVEINKMNDMTPISDRNERESLKAIFERLKTSLGEFKGHSLKVTYNASSDSWYILDATTQYAIYPKINPDTNMQYSIFDLTVADGKTLGQILSELSSFNKGSDLYNAKVAEIIQKLSLNAYFEELFNTWNNTKLSDTTSVNTAYYNLIGDFIYLGKIKDPNSPVQIKDGKLVVTQTVVDSRGRTSTVTKEVYTIPTSNALTGETNAIEMLQAIFQNRDVFVNTPPQRSFNLLDSNPEKFANLMIGLVDMDFLYGNMPDSYTRRGTLISNPFFRMSNRGFTTVTDKNAAQTNPGPQGARANGGGRVDTLTGNILNGIVNSIEQRANEFVKAATQKVQGLINNLVLQTDLTKDPNKTGDTNYKKGNLDYARTTHVESAIIGGKATKYENSGEVRDTPPTALGNTFDPVVREAFMTFNALLETGAIDDIDNPNFLDSLYETIRLLESFKDSNYKIPNVNKEDVKEVLKTLVSMHKFFKANNIIIVPKGVRVYGEITVKRDGIPYGKLPTAGTLDLLAYDKTKDVFYVIDIKTIHSTANTKEQAVRALDSRSGDWQAQTSTYWELVCQSQTSITQLQEIRGKFGGNFIFPIFLDYNIYDLQDKEIASDRMTIGNGDDVLSAPPRTLNSFNRDGQITTMSDFLYPVEPIDTVEYDYNLLSEDQRHLIKIGSSIEELQGIDTSEDNGEPTPIIIADNDDEYPEVDDDDPYGINYSVHSEKQSKFIDFINNRIAPISLYKVSFVTKIYDFIKNFKEVLSVDKAIERDFAVTFFNGDEEKMNEIAKIPINSKNMYTVVQNMATYYKAYVEKRQQYKQRLIQRHTMAKALYDFLDGKFGVDLLYDVIQQIGLLGSEITELTEYQAAEDKEKAALEIKKRLEASDIFDDKAYTSRMQELDKQMDDMETKLLFLQNANAAQMLVRRIDSIKEAISQGKIKELPYSVNGSLADILSGRRTNVGARVILTELRRRSKSSYMKALTNAVLEAMDRNGISTIVNIVDNALNTSIEGETTGSVVYIHKSSLDSQEHFERVLLHEMMHVIAKLSPEIKEKLLPLLDEVVQSIQRETGMTEQEVRESTYGLKDVDEFIAEFFTNFAFLESLRDIAVRNEKYDSIYDKVMSSIKGAFRKNTSAYSMINKLMNQVLSTSNTASLKRTVISTERYSHLAFDNLTEAQHTYLEELGFTREEYEMISRREKQHLLECCN